MTVAVTARSQWGAQPPRGSYSALGPAVGLTFHWEGTPLGPYSAAAAAGLIRTIQAIHLANSVEGYIDIAYNFVVDRHGQVFEGRGWGHRSGANGSSVGNGSSYAVCYLGGPGDPFTAAASTAFVELRNDHLARGGSRNVWPHSDWVATQCPGDEVRALARLLNGQPPGPSGPSGPSDPWELLLMANPDLVAALTEFVRVFGPGGPNDLRDVYNRTKVDHPVIEALGAAKLAEAVPAIHATHWQTGNLPPVAGTEGQTIASRVIRLEALVADLLAAVKAIPRP